jgi:hypothetical protein
MMNQDFSITIDSEEFRNYDGVKINYSNIKLPGLCIQNHSLLFENNIREQAAECFETNGYKAFFKIQDSDIAFDMLAASFYLLSRYEEYLPHKKDIYGRYSHEDSLAFKEGFLNSPLINCWVKDLSAELKKKYPGFNVQYPVFNIVPTYDIDIAYSYKHKGLLRNIGGFLRSPSTERLKVLLGSKKDPFDSYAFLDGLHKKYGLRPIYFFLVTEKPGRYDKNISPHKDAAWELVKQHAKKYLVGLHPSWQSGDNFSLLKKEKQQLEAMSDIGQAHSGNRGDITRSRYHYIRFNLPSGYRRLTEAGITDDYSMGYGNINGFRASVASSFFWYDLEKEEQTTLRIHPFCFMEANSFYEQKISAQQALDELMHYYNQCKVVNGTMITIWHNNFLGTSKEFKGWKEIYEQFIAQAQQ